MAELMEVTPLQGSQETEMESVKWTKSSCLLQNGAYEPDFLC